MKSYKHFSISGIEILSKLHKKGLSSRKIAELLNRNPSSITRELKRNSKIKNIILKKHKTYIVREEKLCVGKYLCVTI